jgi:cystathionine beta-lyase family protein involved in aluminum resistance
MAWQSGAVRRLRGFQSPEVLLRLLMLHLARGYSLRETVVRARLANWTDISDVALLKRLRHREGGCASCVSNCFGKASPIEGINTMVRIVDGTIVREPGGRVARLAGGQAEADPFSRQLLSGRRGLTCILSAMA